MDLLFTLIVTIILSVLIVTAIPVTLFVVLASIVWLADDTEGNK